MRPTRAPRGVAPAVVRAVGLAGFRNLVRVAVEKSPSHHEEPKRSAAGKLTNPTALQAIDHFLAICAAGLPPLNKRPLRKLMPTPRRERRALKAGPGDHVAPP